MKKIIIAFMLCVLLTMTGINKSEFSLLDYFDGEYFVYTKDNLENSTDLGFCYMSKVETTSSVIGESIRVKNFEPVSVLKTLNAKLLNTEVLEDGTVVMYAYSDLINDYSQIKQEKTNLQIAYKDDACVIGWPLILGSF